MTGIFERIASLSGTETHKAMNFAYDTFHGRLAEHGHTGRALIETVAEVCRNHPNLVGIGAGLLVEQLLVEEKRRHESHLNALPATAAKPRRPGGFQPRPKPHHIRPGRIAREVFGALFLLKFAALGARLFRKKGRPEPWLERAGKVRLLSGSIAAYHMAAAARSPKISAWRNAAIALFATDAVKPVLKRDPRRAPAPRPVQPPAPALAEPAAMPLAEPAFVPVPPPAPEPPPEMAPHAPSEPATTEAADHAGAAVNEA